MNRTISRLSAVTVAVAATLAAGITASVAEPAPGEAPTWPETGVTVVTHRCNTAGDIYTEQTQAACVKALASGATTIDVDLRWTSTNTPVALHDPTLALFGAPSVAIDTVSYTAARRYVSTQGQVLSTLTQLRDLAVATGADLSVEPKTTMTTGQWDKFDAILGSIRDRVLLNSFDPATIAEARFHGYTRLGMSASTPPATLPPDLDVVILEASAVTAPEVERLTGLGVAVWCYACDTPASWEQLTALGVTGFATDDHVGARAWLAAQATP